MNFRRHRVMVATRSRPAQRLAAPQPGTRAYTAVVSGVLRPLNSPLHGMHAHRLFVSSMTAWAGAGSGGGARPGGAVDAGVVGDAVGALSGDHAGGLLWPRRRRLRGRQPTGGRLPVGRPGQHLRRCIPELAGAHIGGDHLPRSQGLGTSGDDGLVSADAGDAQQRHAVGQRRGDAAAGDCPGSRAQPGRRRRSRGGDRARLRHRRRAGRTGRILATPELACAGQLHGHWKEAGMVARDQPRNDGCTVVLRRQPPRIMNGRPQAPAARRSGGCTGSVSSPS